MGSEIKRIPHGTQADSHVVPMAMVARYVITPSGARMDAAIRDCDIMEAMAHPSV